MIPLPHLLLSLCRHAGRRLVLARSNRWWVLPSWGNETTVRRCLADSSSAITSRTILCDHAHHSSSSSIILCMQTHADSNRGGVLRRSFHSRRSCFSQSLGPAVRNPLIFLFACPLIFLFASSCSHLSFPFGVLVLRLKRLSAALNDCRSARNMDSRPGRRNAVRAPPPVGIARSIFLPHRTLCLPLSGRTLLRPSHAHALAAIVNAT